jgi:parvulin-like peptidyl-prolyl isomerase
LSVITIRFNEDDEELLKFIEEYSKKNYLSKSAFCKVAIREFRKSNQTEDEVQKQDKQDAEVKESEPKENPINLRKSLGGMLK